MVVRVWFRELVAALPVRVRMSAAVVEAVLDEDVMVLEPEPEVLLLVPVELVPVAVADSPMAVSPPTPVKTRTPSSDVSWADIGLP